MADAMIAERIRIARRYVRAVDMTRDFTDPRALEGYIVTPSVRDALARVTAGLAPGSTQRAFRVTGPYGAGKSSFGLLLARLFTEVPNGGSATDIARSAISIEPSAFPAYIPIILVGRRTRLADELIRRIIESAAAEGRGRDELTAASAAHLMETRAAGAGDARAVLDLIDGYARNVHAATGSGVLLLIDEMGRYLEYAATNQATEDPSLFQQLAERAGGAASAPLSVIGFLHHRFSDYVAGLGEWIEGEWARSAERYEELAFQESTELTLFLLRV